MCGRTRCTLDPALVERATGVPPEKWVDKDKYHPSYNLSPGRYTPILRTMKGTSDDTKPSDGAERSDGTEPTDGSEAAESTAVAEAGKDVDTPRERVIQCMKWGLVPSFTKKDERPDFFRMFNARGESVHERAAFRRLLPRGRCVAMAEGFYEWKKDERSKAKQPYYIHLDGSEPRPLMFAALCDRWEDAEGHVLHTYTILTTRVSKALEWLHDRMPVILTSQSKVDTWLRPELPVEELLRMAKPYESPDLVWHPVTSEIGKPSFDSPACVKEVTPTSAATSKIASLFKKVAKPEPKTSDASNVRTGSDGQPVFDDRDEEKAFAAAVIPDRDVTKALGDEKNRTGVNASEKHVDASETGEGTSEGGERPFGSSVNASEGGGLNASRGETKASESKDMASAAGINACEQKGTDLDLGVNASEGVRGLVETAGNTFVDAVSEAETVVEKVVEKVGEGFERVRDSVGATIVGSKEGPVDENREHHGASSTVCAEHLGPVKNPGGNEKGNHGSDVSKGTEGTGRSMSPRGHPRKVDGRPAKGRATPGKGGEPSPKKQKTLTAFFTKK